MRALLVVLLLLSTGPLQAKDAPASLATMAIDDRGEMLLQGDDISYQPWRSDQPVGKVQVLQYLPATTGGSKRYEAFTDALREQLPKDSYHVTTILNLDAALWGTGGLVTSTVTANKRKYPLATFVIDAEGSGVSLWELGREGAALAVFDADGALMYFTRDTLSPDDIAAGVKLVDSLR